MGVLLGQTAILFNSLCFLCYPTSMETALLPSQTRGMCSGEG